MTLGGQALEYRRLRAPREDRALVVDPPFSEVAPALALNRTLRDGYRYDLHGRSLCRLSDDARAELIEAARRYTAAYRDVPAELGSQSVFLAGHQPELFHPGVWCKNFALSSMAIRHGATAVNLVVDSDTIKRASMRVPGGSAYQPQVSEVPFDQPADAIPYEERAILDGAMFESFGNRAAQQIRPLVNDPLVATFWPRVLERARERNRLGECLAQARHQLEGEWGGATLELPQSQVCRLPTFLWFAAHLLAEAPRLKRIYNESVAEYRRVNHIRSHNHPVPDLAQDGEWSEAPFWIWTSESPHRRRLFVRVMPGGLELTDRQGWHTVAPLAADNLATTVEALARLPELGVKLRSRALVTTLFARLVLGELFMHGIGGAKYDELTDLIIRRFFGIDPPRYMFLSATLLLPIDHERPRDEDLRSVNQRLRDLVYHPEAYLPFAADGNGGDSQSQELVKEKRRWIATPQTRDNARARCRAIRSVNRQLQPLVEDQRTLLAEQRDRLSEALRGDAILSSREYAFCLYPADTLREYIRDIESQAIG